MVVSLHASHDGYVKSIRNSLNDRGVGISLLVGQMPISGAHFSSSGDIQRPMPFFHTHLPLFSLSHLPPFLKLSSSTRTTLLPRVLPHRQHAQPFLPPLLLSLSSPYQPLSSASSSPHSPTPTFSSTIFSLPYPHPLTLIFLPFQ